MSANPTVPTPGVLVRSTIACMRMASLAFVASLLSLRTYGNPCFVCY